MSQALYQTAEIQKLESLIIQNQLNDASGLMQLAGQAALELLLERWPKVKSITIFCGKGNNAGDGFVLARLATKQGIKVQLLSADAIDQFKNLAIVESQKCLETKITIEIYRGQPLEGEVIIDALLGIGLKGNVEANYTAIIHAMNESGLPILSVDIPSGLDANTGEIKGAAVKATATVTFLGFKLGLFTYHGPAYAGSITLDRLQVPDNLYQQIQPTAELLNWGQLKNFLAKRSRDSHKGDYGHVLIIGGDYGMGGAVRMAAEAALRVGAGLVSVATRPEHVCVVNVSRPEIMCHQVINASDLEKLLSKMSVIVIGPGLGKSDWARELLAVIEKSSLPKVVDADALNLLSENPRIEKNWVLTPHPGEASRLLGISTLDVQHDRFASTAKLQKKYGGIIVLKGSGTLIRFDSQMKVAAVGNPGMASGGMGDVLSGVIGGLIAQKIELPKAVELGVLIHGLAGDEAAKEEGERGLLATDLMKYIHRLVNP